MEIRRCMKCMHSLQPGETVCPVCGWECAQGAGKSFALKPGSILEGKYLVGEMLGQGGFGITYIGLDLLLEQKVAIKEYFPMSTGMVSRDNCSTVVWSDDMMRKSGVEKGFEIFLKEARKMAKLGGIPGVVGVKSVFVQNETAYIVMDFVEGETLLEKLKREGPMEFDTCVSLLMPILEALEKVHKQGIIHRDISPDNIMVQPDGQLILLDLGAAKDLEIFQGDGMVQSSQLVAKHGFSPVEQYGRNGNIGPWTDVYAVAATVYYCCTGVVPPVSVDRIVEDTLICQPLLTEEQFHILSTGMTLQPKKRPQHMETLRQLLMPKESVPPKDAKKTPPGQPETKPKDRKPQTLAPQNGLSKWLTVGVIIAVLAIGGILRTTHIDIPPETTLGTEITETTMPVEETESIPLQETVPVRVVEDPGRIVSVDVNSSHIAAVYADGTVDAIYFNEDYFTTHSDVQKWRDIVAVSAGNQHTVGLRSDGTVVAAGFNTYGECDVSDWSDIVDITAGYSFTAGLKSDGTVVYTGYNNFAELYDVSDLRDVIAIDASHASGRALDCLLSDGTWIRRGHVGGGEWGTSEKMYTFIDVAADENGYISKADNIIDISTGTACSVGLKADGTVKLIKNLKLDGYSGYPKPDILAPGAFDTSSWRNIVAVSANRDHVVGLRKDGTVAFTGPLNSRYKQHFDMSDWTNITGIYAGGEYIIGLTEGGTLLAAGMTYIADGEWERLDVSALNRKVIIEEGVSYNDMYPNHTTDAEGFVLVDNSDAAQDKLCILGYKVSNGLEIQSPYCYSNDSMMEIGFTWKNNDEIAQTLIAESATRDFSLEMVELAKNRCIRSWEDQVWFGNRKTPENKFSGSVFFAPEETYYALLLCFDRNGEYAAYAVLKIGYPIP